ncbi:hypothetical protein [Polaribacter staleyi]|uniref:hypothetical protein n=1 Tax=Polaribacter staleyi TaxID=2022337 RepID=UPI0031B9F19A
MDNFFLKYLYFFLLVSFFLACKSGEQRKIYSKKTNNYVLSSRFFHPRDSNDPQSTINTIIKLKPKRIDWVYHSSKKVLEIYQDYNLPYSLAINPQIPDSIGYTTKSHRIVEYTGGLYVAPWMKKWKIKNPHWGCVNNPKFNKLFLSRSLYLSSLKPYAIFVDDALFNVRLKRDDKVGCFCEYCVLAFKKKYNDFSFFEEKRRTLKKEFKKGKVNKVKMSLLLKDFITKYEDFQEESVISFLENWKKEVKIHYPKMKFLTNNYNGSWNSIYSVFDGGIAELNAKYINKNDLDSIYHVSDSLNKSQLFSIASSNDSVQKKLLEYNAKNNRESLYPWDIFISGEERYYMPIDSILKIKKEIIKN